jgi:peptide/nickel transport system substrate-binding protein
VPETVAAAPADEVTRLVVVTATPAPSPFFRDDTTALEQAVAAGPITLDPAQASDEAGATILRNVLETLVYPHPQNAGEFVPLLASRWEVENGGTQYTFTLRRGVTFSNGAALTADDVAYSLQRMLLQSSPGQPQTLLLEPLFGYESGDVTEGMVNGPFAGSRAALLENSTDQQRVSLCQQIQEAISAAAGAITITLADPWSPLLAILSQPWAGVVNREWAAARGDWDGSCDRWSNWYGRAPGEGALATAIMGTGPYVLDHWTPGSEYELRATEPYWRSSQNPMWPGGPAGQPVMETVRVVEVADDAARWELLLSGQVAAAPLSAQGRVLADQLVGESCDGEGCTPGPVPAGPLRRLIGSPVPEFLAIAFNFDINVADNPYVGSGELDGDGIPADFFADLPVRRAFAFCFDGGAYLDAEQAVTGAGSLLPAGWETAPAEPYVYDSRRCETELLLAWESQLPTTGFWLQIPYLAGAPEQQAAATLLQARIHEINANYVVEIVGLPEVTYQRALRSRQLPVAFVRWQPPLPDPHYHVAPLLSVELEEFQSVPASVRERLEGLLSGGLEATTLGERQEQYRMLGALWQEELPFLPLPRPAAITYQQRWLTGLQASPEAAAPYFYAVAEQGAVQ